MDGTQVMPKDWRDYINDAGYFQLTIEGARVLGSLDDVRIEVSADDSDADAGGPMLALYLPPAYGGYQSVWFHGEQAAPFAQAVHDAVNCVATHTTRVLQALSCYDDAPVAVTVATDSAAGDGVILGIQEDGVDDVVVDRGSAEAIAAAVLAGRQYVIDNRPAS